MPNAFSSVYETAWDRLSLGSAQVLFCDLQQQIVAHSKTTSPGALASAAGALLQLAKLFSLPVIRSVVPEGKDKPSLISELEDDGQELTPALSPPLLRTQVSLFGDKATEQAIADAGREVLIVSGFMVEAVVLTTVLDARQRGYAVLVPIDACGGASARTEAACLRQMEAAGVLTTCIVSLGVRLQPDLSSQSGQEMFSIVNGGRPD